MTKKEIADRSKFVIEVIEIGYAGILPDGQIVDRRNYTNAIPIPKNSLLKTPKPVKLPTDK